MIRRFVCTALLSVTVVHATAAEGLKDDNVVVASQGGSQLTLADIDAYVQRIPETDRAGFMNSPKRIEMTIINLLAQKQLAAEAEKGNLDKDPMVQRQLELARAETLARVRSQQFARDLKTPDFTNQAREQFLAHKADYVLHGNIEVQHVLISTTDHEKEDAHKIALDVEKQAKANPADFDKLVEKYSEDKSKADNKGVMKDAGSKNYVERFSQAARELKKPNDISPVILTQFGYHVLKLIKREPDVTPTYEQVADEIKAKLATDWHEAQVRGRTDEIRSRAMDANPDAVASLRERYMTAGAKLPPLQQAERERALQENQPEEQGDKPSN